MPRKSRLKLTPVTFGNETLGQRLARIRKERGLTQNDVAQRTGLTQVLVSDYERDRLRLSAEMAVRFVEALESRPTICYGRARRERLLRPSNPA